MSIQSVLKYLKKSYATERLQRYLIVSVDEQKLYLLHQGNIFASYDISTSKYGLGEIEDSMCTPTGAHCIKEKIGKGVPLGSVFVGRIPTGEIVRPQAGDTDSGPDLILTRILWLQGMEQGINLGGNRDSYRRYIYIHGTHAEGLLGQAASHGCIRMANSDIIELFEQVQVGDLVFIH